MSITHPTIRAGFWNVWGHRRADDIHAFITKQDERVDIWCLTEVTSMNQVYDPVPVVYSSNDPAELPSRIDGLQRLLKDFSLANEIEYISPEYTTWKCQLTNLNYNQIGFGSAMLIKRNLDVIARGHYLIEFDEEGTKPRVIQWVVFQSGGDVQLVAHLHGVWIRGNTKGDDHRRSHQSRMVRQLLYQLQRKYAVNKTVFGGDLNLDINTEALKLLECGYRGDKGYRNLNRLFDVDNTRTADYRKFNITGESKHADYVLISANVMVSEGDYFVGNQILGSDHAPLLMAWS